MTATHERIDAARDAIAAVIHEYDDVFGPSKEVEPEAKILTAWVMAIQWNVIEERSGWSNIASSGCPYPMRVGLYEIGRDAELHGESDD